MQQCILFLDLEGTVIKNWSSRNVFLNNNLSYIQKAISKWNLANPTEVIEALGLFSYAINGEADKRVFNTEIKDEIEEQLGLKFEPSLVFTKEDFTKAFLNITRIQFIYPNDWIDFMGDKGTIFMRVMPYLLPHGWARIILVDDIVGDMNLLRIPTKTMICTRFIQEGLSFSDND